MHQVTAVGEWLSQTQQSSLQANLDQLRNCPQDIPSPRKRDATTRSPMLPLAAAIALVAMVLLFASFSV